MADNEKVSAYRWLRLLLAFLIVALTGAVLVMGMRLYHASRDKGPEISAAYIENRISPASKLVSAELDYRGLIKYSDGKIPYLTQKAFSMIYSAKMRAGIDFSRIEVELGEDKVTVTLPPAEIQSVEIDPDSIEFYDEHLALFNWTNKEDAVDAIKAAREDLLSNADSEALKAKALEQAKALIAGLLEGSTGGLELEVK